MFNSPRNNPTSSFLQSHPNTSNTPQNAQFNDPLAPSAPALFGEMDPWSSTVTPERSISPPKTDGSGADKRRDGMNGLTNDPPALYVSLLDQLDVSGRGQVSLDTFSRLLSTAKLTPSVVEKIILLTSHTHSSLTRSEFFCALALVSLAQSSIISDPDEISIERLSAVLESDENLPLPNVAFTPVPDREPDISTATSTFALPNGPALPSHGLGFGGTGFNAWAPPPSTPNGGISDVIRTHSASFSYSAPNSTFLSHPAMPDSGVGGSGAGVGTGPGTGQNGSWRDMEIVKVELVPEKEGWFLQKYSVESSKRGEMPVSRRYSDFVWLMDVLSKRYPFRLLPPLPPKRLNPDASFLESRRLALTRLLNFLTNHPVLTTDACLSIFLTEPTFESWRKRNKVSTDEESASKVLSKAQEMSIPSDLEEKLGNLRDRLPGVLSNYSRLVTLGERSLARLQVQAGDMKRMATTLETIGDLVPRCCFRNVHVAPSDEAGGIGAGNVTVVSRSGGKGCEVCEGVGKGWADVGTGFSGIGDELEKRIFTLQANTESLKFMRDLYTSWHLLFLRHDKLSPDAIDSLIQKIESRGPKIEALRATPPEKKKPNWQDQLQSLLSASAADDSEITRLRGRRVFVRACMWHELAIVWHSKQAAQATLGWGRFVEDEMKAGEGVRRVWEQLEGELEGMPVE